MFSNFSFPSINQNQIIETFVDFCIGCSSYINVGTLEFLTYLFTNVFSLVHIRLRYMDLAPRQLVSSSRAVLRSAL